MKNDVNEFSFIMFFNAFENIIVNATMSGIFMEQTDFFVLFYEYAFLIIFLFELEEVAIAAEAYKKYKHTWWGGRNDINNVQHFFMIHFLITYLNGSIHIFFPNTHLYKFFSFETVYSLFIHRHSSFSICMWIEERSSTSWYTFKYIFITFFSRVYMCVKISYRMLYS